MNDEELKNIIETIESKQRDCEAFSKKYKQRNQEDLYQYYEGAGWAFKFILHLFNETNQKK